MKAPGAKYETWRCQSCGHKLIDHAPKRDSTPAAPRPCLVPGCWCKSAVTAFIEAKGAT